MTEPKIGIPPQASTPPSTPLTPQLEARIAAFESAAPTADFDHASWLWMILLGVAMPVALLIVGWWA